MGDIEDIYEDLDADVSEEAFRDAVAEKVEQMGGLADEETAAMLIAHELSEGEVSTVADIEPGMEEVSFTAKVLRVDDLRTFERDGEDEDGKVINAEAADETGSVRLAFWDERAQAVADGEIEAGDVLKVNGRPKDGYNGLEVSVNRAEVDDETDVDVELGDGSTVDSLTLGQSDVNLSGLVLDTESVRTFDRDDGSEGKVANLTLGDETGRVRVTLWDDQADRAAEVDPGTVVEVVDGYVRERDGDLELHVGDRGAVEQLDEDVEYVPDATPIAEVELDQTVDVSGVVRSTDPKRTFDRDDGSEGQVRNVRVQDDSGDIRVALWGEKADKDLAPGDEVLCADVEIQDGWQDDLEASAGWQSTVVVLEDGASATAGDSDEESTAAQKTGLSAYEDASGGTSGTDDAETSDTVETSDSAETTEFTGTVVQAGNPVILDDGEQTISVETDEHVQLGQEITVRGRLHDDRLDAEDVF